MEMTLTVHVPRRRPHPVDVVVEWSGRSTVAELCAALSDHLGEPVPGLSSGGRALPADGVVGMPPLLHGASVSVATPPAGGAHATTVVPAPRAVLDLVVVGGPDAGRRHPLSPPGVAVGRAPVAGLVVDDESLSRSHLYVAVGTSGVTVEDRRIDQRGRGRRRVRRHRHPGRHHVDGGDRVDDPAAAQDRQPGSAATASRRRHGVGQPRTWCCAGRDRRPGRGPRGAARAATGPGALAGGLGAGACRDRPGVLPGPPAAAVRRTRAGVAGGQCTRRPLGVRPGTTSRARRPRPRTRAGARQARRRAAQRT